MLIINQRDRLLVYFTTLSSVYTDFYSSDPTDKMDQNHYIVK